MVEATSIDLQGLLLLEEDVSGGHCDAVWRYPKAPASLCRALTSRWKEEGWGETVLADGGDSAPAATDSADGVCPSSDVFIGRVEGGGWYYVKHYAGTRRPISVSGVRSFAICCTSNTFNPERYSSLLSLLVDEYAREATPTKLLEAYLRVFTSGNFRSWKASAYANKAALLGAPGRGVVLQDLYTTFGAEGAMHCWTAIMLRRRIVVYSKPEASAETQRFVRALPQLAWQRGPDVGIVVPGSSFADKAEVARLRAMGVYVAGTADARCRNANGDGQLWDLLLDLDARNAVVSVAAEKEGIFGICKIQKDIGKALAEAVTSSASNQATIKAVATSTMGVLKKLRGLVAKAKEEGTGLPDQLEAHGVVGYTAAFLLDLASAENLA